MAVMSAKTAFRYFKGPNAVFEVGLSPYDLVVLLFLIRRTGEGGKCFPGLNDIRRGTGIKSLNGVRKSLRSLSERGLISIVGQTRNGSRIYQISIGTLEAAAREREVEPLKTKTSQNTGFPPPTSFRGACDEREGSSGEHRRIHVMNGGGSSGEPEVILFKEDSFKEDREKEEKEYAVSDKTALSPSYQNRNNLLTETNSYFYRLTPKQKRTFDEEASRIHLSTSAPSLAEKRELRRKLYWLIILARSTFRQEHISARALRHFKTGSPEGQSSYAYMEVARA